MISMLRGRGPMGSLQEVKGGAGDEICMFEGCDESGQVTHASVRRVEVVERNGNASVNRVSIKAEKKTILGFVIICWLLDPIDGFENQRWWIMVSRSVRLDQE